MSDPFERAPNHWRTIRLKHTVAGCQNGTWGEEPRGGEDDLVCVRVADFDRLRLRVVSGNPTLRFVPKAQRRARLLRRGDLLLEKSGGGELQPVGAVALYTDSRDAVCSNFIARMPAAPGFDPAFLCYLHAALYFLGLNQRSIQQTTGIQNLDAEAYLSETVRTPDLCEQKRIAGFLNRKTGVIDGIIRNKERLVDLLREKRQALISRAVTQGLDRHARMKPSGVGRLGEIPAHWQATRFKFIRSGALLYGANEPADGEDPASPRYIRITDVNPDGTLRDDTFKSLPEEVARPYLLEDGDVLLARSGATVGKAIRYRREWGRACFAGYLVRLRPDPQKVHPDYLAYHTQSHAFRQEIRISTSQATIPNVSAERFGNFAIALGPLEEQRAIVDFLHRQTATLDALVSRIQAQREKLREYRQTLIAAAVTGELLPRDF